MKKYNTIIIEDEKEDLDLMVHLLEVFDFINISGTAEDVETGIAIIAHKKPDLIFLDIRLYGRTSFDILDAVNKLNIKPKVIFTTAFDNFMSKAFKYSAFDYLLKPVDRTELKETLTRFIENENQEDFDVSYNKFKTTEKKIVFNTISGFEVINPEDIVYITTIKTLSYTELFLRNGSKTVLTKSIGEVETQLSQPYFYKIHRSFILNLNFVKKVNRVKKKCFLVSDNAEYQISVSREKIKLLKEKLNLIN